MEPGERLENGSRDRRRIVRAATAAGAIALGAAALLTADGLPFGRARTSAATAQPAPAAERTRPEPLLPIRREWPISETWKSRRVGNADFYFVENGPYTRVRALREPDLRAALVETGIWQRAIPGYLPARYINWLGEPGAAGSAERQLLSQYVDRRWPIWSISYVTAKGEPLPTAQAIARMGDLWVGDGMTESMPYRFEGVLNYLRMGRLGKFSSSRDTDPESWAQYMERQLVPELRRVLPEALNKSTPWTHREARTLADAFMRTYFEKIGRPVAWGVYLSPYTIAAMEDNVAVGERSSSPIYTAQARGLMRTAGGDKFFLSWQPAEEAARWMGHASRLGVIAQDKEAHGYELEHIRSMMWRPFMTGAQYFVFHPAPLGLIADVEQDGHYELNALGETFHDIMDMAEALPDRGVAYSSVGLLLDRDRNFAASELRPTTTYLGLPLAFDEADFMINGLLHQLFPIHPQNAGYKLPNHTAPYGEIFDILSPNPDRGAIDPSTLAGYPVLFDLGGLQVDEPLSRALQDYVRNGGSLVMNVADLGEALPASFFGVSAGTPRQGDRVAASDGSRFDEERFTYQPLTPLRPGATEVLYRVGDEPLVTRHPVGRGQAILVGARYMIRDESVADARSPGGQTFQNRPLLAMVPHLIDRLTSGTMPIELRCAERDRQHLTWWVRRRSDSWLVFVQGFDRNVRFERRGGHPLNIIGDYEFEPIEFDLVSRVPIVDAVDLYGRRSIELHPRGSEVVATDFVRYGDVRIYQLSDHPIELRRTRPVNWALGRPARASHTLVRAASRPKPGDPKTDRYAPSNAVDGVTDNRRYWQSGRGFDPNDREAWTSLPLPAWLEVDLEGKRTVDHVSIQFHRAPVRETVEMLPRIIRYAIELSSDGRKWKRVVDESENVKPLRPHPTRKWFEPVEARYARVTVFSNTERRGAQIVEFGVYGPEREEIVEARRSPWPPWRAFLPVQAQNWPGDRQRYLSELKPDFVRNSSGTTYQARQSREWIRTVYDTHWGGQSYDRVLDVTAPHEVHYAIPPDAQYLAAVAGFRTPYFDRRGVVYRVLVDGETRFDSGPYYGLDALPIFVPVRGGRTLSIVVEDLADGGQAHAALLAEARFLLGPP